MKITDVRVISLAVPLEKPVLMSFGTMTHRKSCLVHVETDQGIDGWGESFVNHPYWALDERKITIEKGIKPLVMGEDPLEIEKLWNKMYGVLNTIGLQAGARGQYMQAISGVDIALWDIKGKSLGVPVYELLGGKLLEQAEVYASGLGPNNLEEQILGCSRYGIRAFKVKVGFGRDTDINNVKQSRAVMGTTGKLMLDANMAWTEEEALRMVEHLKPYDIEWLEEPCRCDDVEALAHVTSKSPVKIAGGENVYCRDGFQRALKQHIFEIAQPDVTKTGGISEVHLICRMANANGMNWAPHFFGNAVGLAATLHVFAAISGGMIVELDANPNPLRTGLLEDPIEIVNGMVEIPNLPGLGITLNQSLLQEFRVS